MKKNLLFLAAVSLMAIPFLVTSCGKTPVDDTPTEIILPDPPTKDVAMKVEFKKSDRPIWENKEAKYEIESIEFTEDSRFILKSQVIAVKSLKLNDKVCIVGKFTMSGSVYICNGSSFSGKVTVEGSGSNANVKVEGDKMANVYDGNADVKHTADAAASASRDEKNANRTWKVNAVKVDVSGGKKGEITKVFNGCNLEEMAKWAAENGVDGLKSHLSEFVGYNVDEILFTGEKTFTISFTGADVSAISGTYSMSQASKSVSISLPEGNSFFHGSIPGNYEFSSEREMSLTLNTTIEGYKGSMAMSLSRAN